MKITNVIYSRSFQFNGGSRRLDVHAELDSHQDTLEKVFTRLHDKVETLQQRFYREEKMVKEMNKEVKNDPPNPQDQSTQAKG